MTTKVSKRTSPPPLVIKSGDKETVVKRNPDGTLQPVKPRKPRQKQDVVTMARRKTKRAIQVLGELMEGKYDADAKTRGWAADKLLDRGWGKAPIKIEGQISQYLLSDATVLEETAQKILKRREKLRREQARTVIDSEFEEVQDETEGE